MISATITSKGQTTLPKAVRLALGVGAGDRHPQGPGGASEVLGERVREAMEILTQSHGEALRALAESGERGTGGHLPRHLPGGDAVALFRLVHEARTPRLQVLFSILKESVALSRRVDGSQHLHPTLKCAKVVLQAAGWLRGAP